MALPGAFGTGRNPPPTLDPVTGEHVLGVPPGTVRLHEYTPLWAELFRVEAAELRDALGALALDIEHVGSTAVPGLVAKPAELSFVQASTIPQAGAIAVKGTARAAGGRISSAA